MDDSSQPPDWMFDDIRAAVDQHGLPGVAMRVGRTPSGALPTFMHLSKARRLRDALDAAIRMAEQAETSENNPPAALYGNVE